MYIIKFLLEEIPDNNINININVDDDYGFRKACHEGHTNIALYLNKKK